MKAASTIPLGAGERFRRVATAPATDRLPLVLIALAGASFIGSPKIVQWVTRVLFPEWPLLELLGLSTFVVAVIAMVATKSIRFSDAGRRVLWSIAGSMVLCSVLLPLACLLAYTFAVAAKPHRYSVSRDPDISTVVNLVDRGGRTITRSGWRPRWSFRAHECVDASEVNGPPGFSWTRIDAMTPRPRPGQLWWDIPPADCFAAGSPNDLAER